MDSAFKYKKWTRGHQQTLQFPLKTIEIKQFIDQHDAWVLFLNLHVALLQSHKQCLKCLFSHISFFNTIEKFSSLLSSLCFTSFLFFLLFYLTLKIPALVENTASRKW